MGGDSGANSPERRQPGTDELANLQPDIAKTMNADPDRDAGAAYEPTDAAPPDVADEAEDAGQQVIGELRARREDTGGPRS